MSCGEPDLGPTVVPRWATHLEWDAAGVEWSTSAREAGFDVMLAQNDYRVPVGTETDGAHMVVERQPIAILLGGMPISWRHARVLGNALTRFSRIAESDDPDVKAASAERVAAAHMRLAGGKR